MDVLNHTRLGEKEILKLLAVKIKARRASLGM